MAHSDHKHRHTHPDHSADLPRLKRIAGQVEGVARMIGDDRHCPEILAQIRAARAALRTVEASILQRHLQSCVRDAMTAGDVAAVDEKLAELTALFKKFDE